MKTFKVRGIGFVYKNNKTNPTAPEKMFLVLKQVISNYAIFLFKTFNQDKPQFRARCTINVENQMIEHILDNGVPDAINAEIDVSGEYPQIKKLTF